MGTMFAQFFAMVAMFFQGLYQLASAFNNGATWANEASGAFADVSRHERNMALQKMMKEAEIDALPKAEVPVLPAQNKKLTKAE